MAGEVKILGRSYIGDATGLKDSTVSNSILSAGKLFTKEKGKEINLYKGQPEQGKLNTLWIITNSNIDSSYVGFGAGVPSRREEGVNELAGLILINTIIPEGWKIKEADYKKENGKIARDEQGRPIIEGIPQEITDFAKALADNLLLCRTQFDVINKNNSFKDLPEEGKITVLATALGLLIKDNQFDAIDNLLQGLSKDKLNKVIEKLEVLSAFISPDNQVVSRALAKYLTLLKQNKNSIQNTNKLIREAIDKFNLSLTQVLLEYDTVAINSAYLNHVIELLVEDRLSRIVVTSDFEATDFDKRLISKIKENLENDSGDIIYNNLDDKAKKLIDKYEPTKELSPQDKDLLVKAFNQLLDSDLYNLYKNEKGETNLSPVQKKLADALENTEETSETLTRARRILNRSILVSAYKGLIRPNPRPLLFELPANISEDDKRTLRDFKELVLKNDNLASVMFGLRDAAIATINEFQENDQMRQAFEYVLDLFNIMSNRHIRLLNLENNTYYIYEQAICEKAEEADFDMAVTRDGLEMLILRDWARKEGIFFDLVSIEKKENGNTIKEIKKVSINRNLKKVADNNLHITSKKGLDYITTIDTATLNRPLEKMDLDVITIPSYNRPEPLRTFLVDLTKAMILFGCRDTSILVLDHSPEKATQDKIMKVVAEYRAKGFNIEFIGKDHIERLKNNITDRIYKQCTDKLAKKSLGAGIAGEVVVDGKVSRQKIYDIVNVAVSLKDIAGKRNLSFLYALIYGSSPKMVSVDDDSSPFLRMVTRERREDISEARSEDVQGQQAKLYKELGISTDGELRDILANPLRLEKSWNIIRKYYAYSKQGKTGSIPKAKGQIIEKPKGQTRSIKPQDRELEQRIRFPEILYDLLPEGLNMVVYEDVSIQDFRDEYLWFPTDYLRAFSTRVGKAPKQWPHVTEQNTRGDAGVPTRKLKHQEEGKIIMGSGMFVGDRDMAASMLLRTFVDSITKLSQESGVTKEEVLQRYEDLQRLVNPAIVMNQAGYTGELTRLCFNTTCLYLDPIIPTPGAAFRLEEPAYDTIIKMVSEKLYTAWVALASHYRLPPTTMRKLEEIRRTNPAKQNLFEPLGAIVWRDIYFKRAWEEMKNVKETDPYKRMAKLGELFLKYEKEFKFNDDQKETMLAVRKEVAQELNNLAAARWGSASKDEKELIKSIAVDFVSMFCLVEEGGKDEDTYYRISAPRFKESEDLEEKFIRECESKVKAVLKQDAYTYLLWGDIVEGAKYFLRGEGVAPGQAAKAKTSYHGYGYYGYYGSAFDPRVITIDRIGKTARKLIVLLNKEWTHENAAIIRQRMKTLKEWAAREEVQKETEKDLQDLEETLNKVEQYLQGKLILPFGLKEALAANRFKTGLAYKNLLLKLEAIKDKIDSAQPRIATVLSLGTDEATKRDVEIIYLAYEARLLKEFIEEVKRSQPEDKPLMVIANLSYGDIVLSAVREELEAEGIRVATTGIGSYSAHHDPYYIESTMLRNEDLEFIIRENPNIVVVDGSNSIDDEYRSVPHYPDSYQGIRNYFLVLEQVLNGSVDTAAYLVDKQHLNELREKYAQEYENLKSKIEVAIDVLNSKSAKAQAPKFSSSFWYPGWKHLRIREDKKPRVIPQQNDLCNYTNPKRPHLQRLQINHSNLIFVNMTLEDELMPNEVKQLAKGFVHDACYFDRDKEAAIFNEIVVYEDEQGKVWFTTVGAELARLKYRNQIKYLDIKQESARQLDNPHNILKTRIDKYDVRVLILDIDGTIMPPEGKLDYYADTVELIRYLLSRGMKVFIPTVEREDKLDERFLNCFSDDLKQHLIIASNGGTYIFGFDAKGKRVPYLEVILSEGERKDIKPAVVSAIGEAGNLYDNEDTEGKLYKPYKVKIGIKPDYLDNIYEYARAIRTKLGADYYVTIQQDKYININRWNKKKAINWFLEHYDYEKNVIAKDSVPQKKRISDDKLLIMADEVGEFGIDRDPMQTFRGSLRINVGKKVRKEQASSDRDKSDDEEVSGEEASEEDFTEDSHYIEGFPGIWTTREVLILLKEKIEKAKKPEEEVVASAINWATVWDILLNYGNQGIDARAKQRVWAREIERLRPALARIKNIRAVQTASLEQIVAARIAVEMGDDRLISFEQRLECLEILVDAVKRGFMEKDNSLEGWIDLHYHTTYSDARASSAGVVFEAWDKGLKAIGIVDHDTFKGLEEAVRAWQVIKDAYPGTDFEVVPGVELTVYADKVGIERAHIVAYFPIDKRISGRGDSGEFSEWLNQKAVKAFSQKAENRVVWNNNLFKYIAREFLNNN
ncbi:hypothetical protein DRH29_03725, partial [candidate division Kazan bacterium]